MCSVERNIVDAITTWVCRRLSQNSEIPETIELNRANLFPLLHAAQHDVPYGVRVAKWFDRRLEFGHVVAGSQSDHASPVLLTVAHFIYHKLIIVYFHWVQVEFDDGDVEDMDVETLSLTTALAKTHVIDDPGAGFMGPFLYNKMSFFSQVWFCWNRNVSCRL